MSSTRNEMASVCWTGKPVARSWMNGSAWTESKDFTRRTKSLLKVTNWMNVWLISVPLLPPHVLGKTKRIRNDYMEKKWGGGGGGVGVQWRPGLKLHFAQHARLQLEKDFAWRKENSSNNFSDETDALSFPLPLSMCYPCYKATNELVLSLSLLPLLQSDECTCSLSLSYPCYKATNALVLSLSYPCYKATNALVLSLSLLPLLQSDESTCFLPLSFFLLLFERVKVSLVFLLHTVRKTNTSPRILHTDGAYSNSKTLFYKDCSLGSVKNV